MCKNCMPVYGVICTCFSLKDEAFLYFVAVCHTFVIFVIFVKQLPECNETDFWVIYDDLCRLATLDQNQQNLLINYKPHTFYCYFFKGLINFYYLFLPII